MKPTCYVQSFPSYVCMRIKPAKVASHYRLTHLIMHAFGIKKPSDEHKYVNHKDLDRRNNFLENLEWVTSAENMKHAYRTNANRKSNAPKRSKPVECYINGKWKKYDSASEAGRQLNLNHGSVSKACDKGHRPGGYQFRWGTPTEPDILEGEEWKTIPNSKAEVSSLGRFKDVTGIVKTPSSSADRYVSVKVEGKSYCLHVLIAQCFLPPPGPGQTQVDHRDRNAANNNVSNLRWATRAENIGYSYANNEDRKSSAPQQSKKVRATKDGQEQIFASTQEAARQLGIQSGFISYYCGKNAEIASKCNVFSKRLSNFPKKRRAESSSSHAARLT